MKGFREGVRFRQSLGGMARFVSLDICLQAVGFVSGVAIIRGLPKETYGQYAVYVGILFASILVSESGLSNVMLNHAAKHDGDSCWTGDLRKSGLYVRRRFGLVSSLLGSGLLAYLLHINGLPVTSNCLAVLAYLASMQAVFVRSNCQVFLRLNGRAVTSQKTLLYASILRLLAVLCVLSLAPASTHLASVILVTTGTYWFESWLMNIHLKQLRLGAGSRNPLQVRRLTRAARRLAPMNIATVGREQAFLIIVSLLGSTVVLGEITAFTRYAIAFTVVNSFLLNILLPRLARLDAYTAVKVVPLCALFYCAVAGSAVLAVHIFAPSLLWILGDSYSDLRLELVIVMAGSSLLSLCSALAMMGQSRSWMGGAWVSVAGSLVWAVSGPLVFDLQTTLGGALFIATQGVPVLFAEIVRFVGALTDVNRTQSTRTARFSQKRRLS